MAYLQRNSYFKDLSGNEVFEGQPHKIEDLEYTSIRISVKTDVSGTLTILQSLDGYTWNEFNDTFAISSASHKQVEIKGRYVYVMYENGAAIASPFQLFSVLSKSGVSAGVGLQEVLVINDSLPVTGLTFDSSSNLLVKSQPSSRVNSFLLNGDTLNSDTSSSLFDVSSYKKSVLSYSDTQSGSSSSLALYASVDGTNVYYVGEILPILNTHTNMRYATVSLDLSSFTHIQIANQSADTIGGITCFLFGIN